MKTLIHSRIFTCDFNSKFAVRPAEFNDDMIAWARSKILPATRDLSLLPEGRRLIVATHGDICIAGAACMMKTLANELSEADKKAAEKFLYESKGRSLYAFIGCVFKVGGGKVPKIDPATLFKSYNKYLDSIWESTVFESVVVQSDDFESVPATSTDVGEAWQEKGVDDKALFEKYMSKAANGENVCFCSNVDDFKAAVDGGYTSGTATKEVIKRLADRESEKKTPQSTSNKIQTSETPMSAATIHRTSSRKLAEQSNKSANLLKILAGIVILLIILAILILK